MTFLVSLMLTPALGVSIQPVVMPEAEGLITSATIEEDEQGSRTSLDWHSDFEAAQEQARKSKRAILAYIPKFATPHLRPKYDVFESQVFENKKFVKFADEFVLYLHEPEKSGASKKSEDSADPEKQGGPAQASPAAALPVGARAVEHARQSVLILDADGWALSRVEVRREWEGGQLPLLNQIMDLEAEAKQRKSVRKKASQRNSKAKLEWLSWTAHSGQETDLAKVQEALTDLRVKQPKKRAPIEVAVILNEAQASNDGQRLLADKELKGSLGAKLWPYFADGFRPEDDTRDWTFLWSSLQHAENTGDAKDYKSVKTLLEKKGACGQIKDEMDETLNRLEKRGRSGD